MQLYELDSFCFNRVYVVFTDNTSLWWLKIFKPGFRHCYVILEFGNEFWLELNPFSNRLVVRIYPHYADSDYISYLKENYPVTILEVEIDNVPLKCAPLSAFTCVEFVKRMLGIHDVLVLSPYQLYKKITNCRKKVLTL
nr:MAG TPA: hypothetical protein [Caudoviricetes sp.]